MGDIVNGNSKFDKDVGDTEFRSNLSQFSDEKSSILILNKFVDLINSCCSVWKQILRRLFSAENKISFNTYRLLPKK